MHHPEERESENDEHVGKIGIVERVTIGSATLGVVPVTRYEEVQRERLGELLLDKRMICVHKN